MRGGRRGFSLVEVVVAVGVFVAGVVAAVALLTQTTRSASARLERVAALRVAQSVDVLLQTESWADVMNRVNTGTPIYADRGGVSIDLANDMAGQTPLAANARFYALILERDETLSPASNDATAAYLSFRLIVRWPAQDETGQALPPESQETFISRTVVRR